MATTWAKVSDGEDHSGFLARSKIWEMPVLLLVAFTLFRPGYWLDQIEAPYLQFEGPAVIEAATGLPMGGEIRVVVSGPDFDSGKISESTFVPVLLAGANGADSLAAAGLSVLAEDRVIKVEDLPSARPVARSSAAGSASTATSQSRY